MFASRVLPGAALVRASRLADQRVDQARLADVRAPDQRDLRQPVAREIRRARGARDEVGVDFTGLIGRVGIGRLGWFPHRPDPPDLASLPDRPFSE